MDHFCAKAPSAKTIDQPCPPGPLTEALSELVAFQSTSQAMDRRNAPQTHTRSTLTALYTTLLPDQDQTPRQTLLHAYRHELGSHLATEVARGG